MGRNKNPCFTGGGPYYKGGKEEKRDLNKETGRGDLEPRGGGNILLPIISHVAIKVPKARPPNHWGGPAWGGGKSNNRKESGHKDK